MMTTKKPKYKIKPWKKRVTEDPAARRERQAIEGVQAMSDYLRAEVETRARTARLRTIRLEAERNAQS